MLTLYRRHVGSCGKTSRTDRRCRCPVWVEGTLGGEYIRRSLDVTSWEAGSAVVNRWNEAGQLGEVKAGSIFISEAVEKYLSDAKARGLRPATLSKLQTIFKKQFVGWCRENGFRYLRELNVERLREFREGWNDAPLAASKKLQRLRGFFYFCIRSEWITKNPARDVGMPRVESQQAMPFSDDEWKAILLAIPRYPLKGIYGDFNRIRLRAFVLLLRYSGLRIGDAVALRKDRIENGRLLLRTTKTGTHVYIPIPPDVSDALAAVNVDDSPHYFWSGRSLVKSAVGDWQRSLRKLFEIAKVVGWAHKFRHTFSISLLQKGVPIDQVSILLGHRSVKITEKHYAAWVKGRQEILEDAVRKTW